MRRAMISAGVALLLTTLVACSQEQLGDVAWACRTSADCGAGARCADGLCERLAGGESASTCPIRVGAGRVAIDLQRGDHGDSLVLRVDGGPPQSFLLPDGVKAANLATCCQHPCCEGAP